jgi:hypothetical protein
MAADISVISDGLTRVVNADGGGVSVANGSAMVM